MGYIVKNEILILNGVGRAHTIYVFFVKVYFRASVFFRARDIFIAKVREYGPSHIRRVSFFTT